MPFIAAGAALGAAAIGGGLSYMGQSSANDTNRDIANQNTQFNAAEAQKTRDWQEMMSNSSYQRAVKDMQAAGLNPMLAYSQGGASTPSGATGYAVQAAPMQNRLSGAASAIESIPSTASSISQRAAAIKNMEEQNKQIQVATAKDASAIKVNEATASNINADTILKGVQSKYYSASEAAQRSLPRYYESQASGIDAQRARDKVLQPVYESGSDITQHLIHGAKKLFNLDNYKAGKK